MDRVFVILILLIQFLVYGSLESSSDLHLVDARLQEIFDGDVKDQMDEAVALYKNIIASLDSNLQADDFAILNRHLAQLSLIMPAALKTELGQADLGKTDDLEETLLLRPGSGELVLAWWRSQDVLPATRINERLQEHLERVAYAQQNYFYGDRLSRLDDRGEVYVRLGDPEVKKEIKFTEGKLVDELYRPGVALSPSDFPSNEVWQYGHVDRSTYYIFVERNKFFQISRSEHLIPPTLRMGFSASTRGTYKSAMLIALLRSIFRQLEPLHPDFAMRYIEVDEYARRLEDEAVDSFVDGEVQNRSTGQNAELNVGTSSTDLRRGALKANQLSGGTTLKSNEFVQEMMFRSQSEDQVSEGFRERNTPAQYSEVLREKEKLEVLYRMLRYMDPDRTTRTEIHWSPVAGGLSPTKTQQRAQPHLIGNSFYDYIIRLTAVQQRVDFTDRVVNQNHYFLKDVNTAKEVTIPVQKMTIRGDTGLFHLALQWDQHMVVSAADTAARAQLGPHLKVSTQRVDSLLALTSDPTVLEMSDIKPVLVRDENLVMDVEQAASLPAYPFETIGRDQVFAIYFEVYNLTFGSEDLTHYEVDYEIVRKKDGLRIFSRAGEKTSTRTDYSSENRTAREVILLDLREYGGKGSLEMKVNITDKTSGQKTHRALAFDVL